MTEPVGNRRARRDVRLVPRHLPFRMRGSVYGALVGTTLVLLGQTESCRRYIEATPFLAGLVLAGWAAALALSRDLRGDVAHTARELVHAARVRRATKAVKVRGRVRVRVPVEDPVLGVCVAAYDRLEPSRAARWTDFLSRCFTGPMRVPVRYDTRYTGLGELEIVLADGRSARVTAASALLLDRRRLRLREPLHVVVFDGDEVTVAGRVHRDDAGALVFDGDYGTRVVITLLGRAPR